jgi:hypothetical protein
MSNQSNENINGKSQSVLGGQGKIKSRGRKGKRKSLDKLAYKMGTRITADKSTAWSPMTAENPEAGLELHSAHGFIIEVVDMARKRAFAKAQGKQDQQIFAVYKEMVCEMMIVWEVGLLAYAAASASSTSHRWCEKWKSFILNRDLLVDEDYYDVLNAFMPVENCVQMNIHHCVMMLIELTRAARKSDMIRIIEQTQVDEQTMGTVKQCLADASATNPVRKIVTDWLMTQTSIIVETEDMMNKLAVLWPLYKYRVQPLDELWEPWTAVYNKQLPFQSEYSKYCWKVVKEDFVVLGTEKKFVCRESSKVVMEWMVKVQATLEYLPQRVPIPHVPMLTPEVRRPFVMSTQAVVRDAAHDKRMIEEVTTAVGGLANPDLSEAEIKQGVESVVKMVEKYEPRETVQSVVQPRKSMVRDIPPKKPRELNVNLVSKPASSKGKLVRVNRNMHVYVTEQVYNILKFDDLKILRVQRKYLGRAAELANVVDYGELKLSEARQARVKQWLTQDRFDKDVNFTD